MPWVSGTKAWYVLRMSNVPSRFGLSSNARVLLQALDDFKTRSLDEIELGRIVRLSAENRKAISETIRKCASLMEKKPDDMKHCIVVIEMCTEILDIANRPPPLQGFPFLKLPREIRARILGMIIDQSTPGNKLVPTKWGNCNCVNPEKYTFVDLSTSQKQVFQTLGKSLGDEFFAVLYRKKTYYFSCCCTLLDQLRTDRKLFQHLRNAHVHWCGPLSDKAFDRLAICPNLRNLTIKISKATTSTLNDREASLAGFFSLSYKNRRLMDSLGADELLLLRNLHDVDVQHISSTQRVQLSEFDRQGLRSLLEAKLKQVF